MEIVDILVILFIVFLFYKYYENKDAKSVKETFYVDYTKKYKEAADKDAKEDIYDTTMKDIDLIVKQKQKKEVNPYFMEMQFHNDYRDTHNAIILMIPNQRQLFNRADLPIINVSTPTNREILPLVKNFIREINRVTKENVPETYIPRDWKNGVAEKEFKSGWDKQQEKLGLPGSLYNGPTKRESLKLIKVDHTERFETEDEIRYVIFMILQKKHVKDQILLKVSFQIDKQDINLDKNFFKKNTPSTLVKIEEAFILGYLTKNSFGKQSVKSEYYNFDGITNGRIFSQTEIMKELNKKRKQYEIEAVFS